MPITVICRNCNKPFSSVFVTKPAVFCSLACRDKSSRIRGYVNRNTKIMWDQRDEIVRLYTTPQIDGTWIGCNTLAKRFSVAAPTIRNILRKHGISIRDAKEAHAHGKRCKPIVNLPVGTAPVCKCGCQELTIWSHHENQWRPYLPKHYHPAKPYHDSTWLYHAYITDNRTMEDIAKEFGVHSSTIRKFADRFDIPIRGSSAAHVGRQVGDKNPAWKGGTTPERQRLYKQGHWREFCLAVYQRDNFKCCRCGSPKTKRKGLHAHHLKPWATNPSLRFDFGNVISLCYDCHKLIHSKKNITGEYLR